MATRSDSSLPLAFAAHQLVERRKTMRAREERLRGKRFCNPGIPNFVRRAFNHQLLQTGNRGRPSRRQTASLLHVMQFVILIPQSAGEEFAVLSIYALAKPIIRDVSRRST